MAGETLRGQLRRILPAPLVAALRTEETHGLAILRGLMQRLARLASAARHEPLGRLPARRSLGKAALAVIVVAIIFDTPVAALMWHMPQGIVEFFADVTVLGQGWVVIVPAVIVALGLGRASFAAKGKERRAALTFAAERALFVATATALPSLVTTVLKHIVGRARPRMFETLGAFHFEPFSAAASKASFPSGHATTAAAAIIAIGAVAPRWRSPILLLASLVFVSRVVIEAHFVSDVLAGALIGFAGASLMLTLFAEAGIAFRRDRLGRVRRRGAAGQGEAALLAGDLPQAPGQGVLSWPQDAPGGEAAERPRLSVVVPMRNEEGNAGPLIAEIEAACAAFRPYEVICIDDGSSDATGQRLAELCASRPNLRVFRHAESCGQSAAIRSGVRAARAAIVATLDGDGQNDPAFIPHLVEALEAGGPATGLVAGQRRGRKDTGFKKLQSRIANEVRGRILQDGTRDTGCGLKAFRREVFLALPYFDGLHRFLPALMRREGYIVALVDVVDRPRHSGRSNYGLFDRLWVGILDLAGVWWLIRRRRRVPLISDARGGPTAGGDIERHEDLPKFLPSRKDA